MSQSNSDTSKTQDSISVNGTQYIHVIQEIGKIIEDYNTITFIDYDDTLLASSFCAANNYTDYNSMSEEHKKQMDKLAETIRTFLMTTVNYGKVCIVTNADEEWISFSSSRYMPTVYNLINDLKKCNKLCVTSAKQKFEKVFPGDYVKWKYCIFLDKIYSYYSHKAKFHNVISLGDSLAEYYAMKTFDIFPLIITKIIKLMERPTITSLTEQLQLLNLAFYSIYAHDSRREYYTHNINIGNQTVIGL